MFTGLSRCIVRTLENFAEHLRTVKLVTHNRLVTGSNPVGPTILQTQKALSVLGDPAKKCVKAALWLQEHAGLMIPWLAPLSRIDPHRLVPLDSTSRE